MSDDFIPKSDSELVRWATNFITVATANITTINFTAGQLNTLTTQNNALNIQIAATDSKREEYKAAVQSKLAARRVVVSTAREYNRIIQSRTNVSPALKVQLGLKQRVTGKTVPPEVPLNVTVSGNSLGVNNVKWERNGNPSSTSFEVWCLKDGVSKWEFVAATNRASLSIKGCQPGLKTYYQVRARNSNEYSEFSEPAVIYFKSTAQSQIDEAQEAERASDDLILSKAA